MSSSVAAFNAQSAVSTRNDWSGGIISSIAEHLQEKKPISDQQATVIADVLSSLDYEAMYSKSRSELDEHITLARTAFGSEHASPDASQCLTLGNLYLHRFEVYGGESYLDQSSELISRALRSCLHGTPQQAHALNSLGNALRARHLVHRETDCLLRALSLHQAALVISTSQGLPTERSLYGVALALFYLDDDEDELNECISLCRTALDACPTDTPQQILCMTDLSLMLTMRFFNRGGTDLDDALTLATRALVATPPDHIYHRLSLQRLGCALRYSYVVTRKLPTALVAVSLLRACCSAASASGFYKCSGCYSECGLAARNAYLHTEDDKYLEEVIACGTRAVEMAPPAAKMRFYTELAVAYAMRSEAKGDLLACDQSIAYSHLANELSQTPRERRPIQANVMGQLLHRYSLLGRLEDIDAAIKLGREVCLGKEGSVFDPEYLVNLSGCLLTRYEHMKNNEDLNEAIQMLRQTIASSPSLAKGVICFSRALGLSYEATCRENDLQEALIRLEDCLTKEDGVQNAERHEGLLILASLYRMRGSMNQNLKDLDRAASVIGQVLESTIHPTLVIGSAHQELAKVLLARYAIIHEPSDLAKSFKAFCEATDTFIGSAANRLSFALEWIDSTRAQSGLSVLKGAYEKTVQLLPRIAYLGLPSQQRLEALRKASRIACDAALHCLSISRPAEALQLLEEGRSVFWNQILHLRTPFDSLPSELSARLTTLVQQLEHGTQSSDQDVKLVRRRHLSEEFDLAVRAARQLPGYEDFLQPARFSSIQQAAKHGPIVVLLAGDAICHALVVEFDRPPGLLNLTKIDYERVAAYSSEFSRGDPGTEDTRKIQQRLKVRRVPSSRRLETVLEDVWTSIVHPIVQHLQLKPSAGRARPRIWWCPTSTFSFIPLHAAGIYSGAEAICCADFVVSSYTPTISALIAARHAAATAQSVPPRMLLFAQSDTPKMAPLPHAEEEARRIREMVPEQAMVDLPNGEEGEGARLSERVLAALPDASVVHLCCHGEQNHEEPLKSCFFIGDGRLTIEELMKVKMPNASFAFLSACQSAMGDRGVPDETLHLAATMHYAGFKSVIGTMWYMADADGPLVASEVYRELFGTGGLEPETETIPYALDTAVARLREQGLPAARWATYVHIGI